MDVQPNQAGAAAYAKGGDLPLTVYRPPVAETPDPEEWVRSHAPDDRWIVDDLGLGQGPEFLGMDKRRERVLVRRGLFFREYEWREWDEPINRWRWWLFEEWRVPNGGTVARKTEITEQLAQDLIERREVRRGR